MAKKQQPKPVPVLAWGYVAKGRLCPEVLNTRERATIYALGGDTIVRVQISLAPKRKAKKQ